MLTRKIEILHRLKPVQNDVVAMRHIAAPCTGGGGTVILNVAERNEESLCFNGDSFSSSPHSVISTVADKARRRDPANIMVTAGFLRSLRSVEMTSKRD